MKTIAGEIQSLRRFRAIQPGKNVLNIIEQIGPYSAPAAALIQVFEAAVPEAPDHEITL